MKSLRSRLILGSALVAVVPLAIVMFLLSQRVGALVREQAAGRLNAALDGLRAQLGVEGERVAEQLGILGRDPTLKRLLLVRQPGDRELDDYLAERRRLLGLGFLRVTEGGGAVIADAVVSDSTGAPATHASATILYQDVPVGAVSGGLLLDAAYLQRLKVVSGADLVLRDSTGRTLAATLPGADAISLSLIGESGRGRAVTASDGAAQGGDVPGGSNTSRVAIGDRFYLGRSVRLAGAPGLSVLGLVSTAAADRTLRALQLAALLLGLAGVVLAVLLGVLWSSQVSGPVEELAAFSRRLSHGDWEEPLVARGVRELETLVEALDRMRRDLQSYRERLVVSERQAAWSQMARKVAHEIKNPLTPIAISVADLQRSYQQQRPDFPQILERAVRTVGEEVETLKGLLQEFSEFGRFPAPRPAPFRVSDLLNDLASLYAREVAGARLVIAPGRADVALVADAGQLKQALVNLIKNGLEALEGAGHVTVSAAASEATLELVVADNGPGLSTEHKASLFVPGFTTKSSGSGLGLTIVERIVSDHHGTIVVEDRAEGGTVFRVRLPRAPASATAPSPSPRS